MSSKVLRYVLWTIVAIAVFAGIILFASETIALYIAATIVVLGLLKDSVDYYRIKNGQQSLGHGYVEHLPLMMINAGFSGSVFFNTGEVVWLVILVGAIVDSLIDFQQDFLLNK